MSRDVALDDKYTLQSGRAYLTGTQALTRLPMMQRQRDLAAGLNTAGFISGYRGSPLGGFDKALWRASSQLAAHKIYFQPGVNEDLGATAVWGSQQVNLFRGAQYDGVFGLWYGKGPGVDRSGDVFKHANCAGVSRYGGVLAVAGDDHTCKSSTLPHQSEYAFMDAQIPVLNPAGVQDILDLGLLGWALSRFSGCWVGFKTIAETVDSSISACIDPDRVSIVTPDDFQFPQDGLHSGPHIRWPDPPLEQEQRLHTVKLRAALAFVRANKVNYTAMSCQRPRIGIVTTGKAYLDVLQALSDLHIDTRVAADIGLTVYKVGLSWPLEPHGIRAFAEGLEELMVVEEKRGLLEAQLKQQLYHWPEAVRPRVIGKCDERGSPVLPTAGELSSTQVAVFIASRVQRIYHSEALQARVDFLHDKHAALTRPSAPIARVPHFCPGCPHNTSTRVPENSRALAGIGCHYMAIWMDRKTETFTQMGGEGASWIGQAAFTETDHVFVNIGDGTYFHSGFLAIRAAVASNVNITYKLLYNDAVAMTGGQPVDGQLTVGQITHQLYGEGVHRICVVSDEPEKYRRAAAFAQGVSIHHRDEMDHLQSVLRQHKGTSVLIYDQTCAMEKRRRRKRGLMVDPPKRLFINQAVCEGCGDCGEQSNCLSIIPVATEFGRKRAIDQSACNKDYTCVKGFCPSFVSVHGGALKKPDQREQTGPFPELPDPQLPSLDAPYSIVVAGVGGTGVVTVGALIGMAAHIEEKGCSVLDMTGLAQKYGAVVSHLRIASDQKAIYAARIAVGEANLLLGCDLVVAVSTDTLASVDRATTHAVVNTHPSMPAAFTQTPDLAFPQDTLEKIIVDATRTDSKGFIDATGLATRLLGDAVFANLLIVGYAYQSGLLPVTATAIRKAIELNGIAVEKNHQAFQWGRLAAHDQVAFDKCSAVSKPRKTPVTFDQVEDLIAHRARHLQDYQNIAYANAYRQVIANIQQLDRQYGAGNDQALTRAVADCYAKVLAYKDEYEVARLYADPAFWAELSEQFEGDYQVHFHLAPPWLSRRDKHTGLALKREIGPWVRPLFSLLHKMRFLRGTRFDIFGHTQDRKIERAAIDNYQALLETLLTHTNQDNYATAVALARTPEQLRGYGHVKKRAYDKVKQQQAQLMLQLKKKPSL